MKNTSHAFCTFHIQARKLLTIAETRNRKPRDSSNVYVNIQLTNVYWYTIPNNFKMKFALTKNI